MHKSGVESLVLNWNKLAMENLREEKYSEAFRLLQKSEELLKYPDGTDSSKLLAITYNNFGCFYKKTQKYSIALKYLFRALEIEISSTIDKTNLAGTHLNICTVYSTTNQHSKALSHGILAVKLLKEANDFDKNLSTMTSLIIALHNTGLEYEFLRDFDNAINTYKCGMDLGIKYLGNDHPITTTLFKSYYNSVSGQSNNDSKPQIKLFKGKNEGLPNINSLSFRNKRNKSSKKFKTQILNSAGARTGSDKGFGEEKNKRKHLPSLEKPKTVAKRSKRVVNDIKVQGLEGKISELQNQILAFQRKYKDLEEKAFNSKPQISQTQAAIIIQRF